MPISVLFVCTGNTCRSAMAEGILDSMVPDGRAGEIRVSSAGTANLTGMPATEHAQAVCREHGIDISGHLSRGLTAAMLAEADVVLAMARHHVDFISSMEPNAARRTFLLSEFADGSDCDVPDPIGGPIEEYETAFEMIDAYVRKALPALLEFSGGEQGAS